MKYDKATFVSNRYAWQGMITDGGRVRERGGSGAGKCKCIGANLFSWNWNELTLTVTNQLQ